MRATVADYDPLLRVTNIRGANDFCWSALQARMWPQATYHPFDVNSAA